MHLFKLEGRFNPKTGKPGNPVKVHAGYVCDFTGKFLSEYSDGLIMYSLDYGSIDPCFGDGPENDLYKYLRYDENGNDKEDWDVDIHDLMHIQFIYDTNQKGDVFEDLYNAYRKENPDGYLSLDYIMRWGRAKMLLKAFKEGNYKPENFIQ